MNKILLPIAALAVIMLPAAANAERCRDSGSGKFAKCGAPGAVLESKYVSKSKAKMGGHAMAMAPTAAMTPMATPAKTGMMSMFKPKPKPMPMASKPMMAKPASCKTAKGKFVKCGTKGAVPA